MSFYVGVNFPSTYKTYTYKVPDYINEEDIQNYVVVENAFYRKGDSSPYIIAAVGWVAHEDCLDLYGVSPDMVTKPIVAAIDSYGYKEARAEMKKVYEAREQIEAYVQEKIKNMSMAEKIRFVADMLPY